MLASCVRNVFHKIEICDTCVFHRCRLAQGDPAPRPERPCTSRSATLHLAQSDPAPRSERPCTLRRATLHLAQSNPVPRAERSCTSRRARDCARAERGGVLAQSEGGVLALTSRSATCLLALREGEMNSQNRLALFFSDAIMWISNKFHCF